MSLRRVSRLPPVPAWAAALGLGCCLYEGALLLLDRRLGLGLATCAFKRLTGHPCPTCGTTRGLLALLGGRPLEALAWNPLVLGCLALLGAVLIFRVLTSRLPGIPWTPGRRRLAWAILAAAVAANWIYLDLKGI